MNAGLIPFDKKGDLLWTDQGYLIPGTENPTLLEFFDHTSELYKAYVNGSEDFIKTPEYQIFPEICAIYFYDIPNNQEFYIVPQIKQMDFILKKNYSEFYAPEGELRGQCKHNFEDQSGVLQNLLDFTFIYLTCDFFWMNCTYANIGDLAFYTYALEPILINSNFYRNTSGCRPLLTNLPFSKRTIDSKTVSNEPFELIENYFNCTTVTRNSIQNALGSAFANVQFGVSCLTVAIVYLMNKVYHIRLTAQDKLNAL